MDVKKEGLNIAGGEVTQEELACINRFTKRALQAEEVYTFAVRLCDNEIDRDGERFTRATLEELAELFVGKSGIFDHEWSAKGQAARIYRTEIAEEEGENEAGERRCYLKAWAYMLRGGGNEELIAQIEGGIKKEVSVGCSVEKCLCSVCGEEIACCGHEKGRSYGGKRCWAELIGAQDAYEWSFVAVPAQKKAGVLKRCGGEENGTLRSLVKKRGSRSNLRELEELEKQAEAGKRYMNALRCEVKRLMLTAEETMESGSVEKMTEKLEEEELRALEKLYRARVERKLGLRTQFSYGERKSAAEDESDFRV